MLDLNRLRVLSAVARTGSVTAAARELHYSQPSVSHHLARLEAETGAQLVQRVGRGIRLTEAGNVLAARAAEVLGRLDAAAAELDTYVGLGAGRVRVAAYTTGLVALLPQLAEVFAARYPGLRIELVDTHPPEALEMLKAGEVDAALIFTYAESPDQSDGIRMHYLRTDPTYLLTRDDKASLADHREASWVGGCVRCRTHLISLCADAGFEPRISYATDDMVAIQSLVAAGMGVATIPGLALRAHRNPDINAHEIPNAQRFVYVATYGEPPDPPPTQALLDVLTSLD